MGTTNVRPATLDDVDFLGDLFYRLHLQTHPEISPEAEVPTWVDGARSAATEQVLGKVKDSVTYVILSGTERVGRLRVVSYRRTAGDRWSADLAKASEQGDWYDGHHHPSAGNAGKAAAGGAPSQQEQP